MSSHLCSHFENDDLTVCVGQSYSDCSGFVVSQLSVFIYSLYILLKKKINSEIIFSAMEVD